MKTLNSRNKFRKLTVGDFADCVKADLKSNGHAKCSKHIDFCMLHGLDAHKFKRWMFNKMETVCSCRVDRMLTKHGADYEIPIEELK